MIIAPSVLSLDYTDTKGQIKELNESGAQWMHFDVMDGQFVPNLTFGPDILHAFHKISPLYKDVHLMVADPAFISDLFLKSDADLITYHIEAEEDPAKIRLIADKIHDHNCKAGLAIKPKTPLGMIRPYLHDFDLFLIMSVEPGFGGQKFMPDVLNRIKELKGWLAEEKVDALIEVDGGINEETGKQCIESGADVLVAGSYIFHHPSGMKEAVSKLCGK